VIHFLHRAEKMVMLAVVFALAQALVPARGQAANHDLAQQQAITENTALPNKRDWLDYSTFGIGVLLAAVTITGVVAAWRGLPELKKQAEAAKDAAIATKHSIDLSRITAKEQLRAYLAARQGRVFLLDGGALRVRMEIENFGQTPAYEIQGTFRCGLSAYPRTDSWEPPQSSLTSKAIVGPRRAFRMGDQIPWTQKDIEGLRNNPNSVFFMTASFTYLDIYKESHRLRVQLVIGGPMGVQLDADESGQKCYTAFTDVEGNEGD
jgi:hypothetical protein